ncbi:MAG: sigma-70 family RNA polymerase sigma factor [Deferribacteres bacterium]|nr:sigma-70 family RNA polymerase sigma factor [candidate division KSB1 bacterium]MCB9502051.1 sigma-70 family RNA polymerase sigma factor [Deferribacteres bacterium]
MEHDTLLVKNVQSGKMKFDHEAENILFQKYYPRIRLKLQFRLHDDQDSIDDLTHEIAIELLHSLRNGNYDPSKATIGSYLNGIINHKLISYFKKRAQGKTSSIDDTADEGLIVLPRITENMDNEKLIQCLRHHLPKLRQNYREVFLLYYHDGFSVKQIAEHLGRSSLTIANEKFQALKILRKKCIIK